MLLNLHVKNIAIIDEEEVDFYEGLNILSGETGAGKSIILGALSLAMGDKPSKSIIRDENKEALAEAVFSVNERQKALLSQMDIEVPENEVILQRKITPQRTSSKINGESVPSSKLAEVAALFIDIYGQHEQQSLLSTKNHLKLIDEYLGERVIPIKDELKKVYGEYTKLLTELEHSEIDENEKLRQIDLLTHEISQIETIAPKEGEDEALKEEYRFLTKGEKISEGIKSAMGDINLQILDPLGRAIRSLKSVSEIDGKINSFIDSLADAESILNDTARALDEYEGQMDLSYERLEEVSHRIDDIDSLKRKYSKDGSIKGIYKTLEENKEILEKYKNHDAYLKGLRESIENSKAGYDRLAGELSALRKESASMLSDLLTKALVDLNFMDPEVNIAISFLEKPTENGINGVCFNLRTNPGEKLKPINEIASGGELSRVMLALKTIFAVSTEIDTLVFDEIDSGISGKTASKVAKRLCELGKTNQVICITHLPQIAAGANHHYLIEKKMVENTTLSSISHLSEEAHIREVARMLAGDDINDAALANAKALIAGGI